MNNPVPSGEPNHSKDGVTLALILGITGVVLLASIFGCGLIGYLVVNRLNRAATEVREKVQQVKAELDADLDAQRAGIEEHRRRELILNAKKRAQVYQKKYEFSREQYLERERLLAKVPLRDSKGNASSGFLRAVGENPESFAKEFEIKEEYLPKMEASKTLEECQRLAVELEERVLKIREERYRPELESLRESVAEEFDDVKEDAYCVVQLTPPISEFAKGAYGLALSFDIVSGMWAASAASLGEISPLPFSQSILENTGQPRVVVIRERERAVEYIVQSVFAENHFDGLSPEACPWRLVTASPDEKTATAAAEQTAAELRAEQQLIRESKKSADPRPVIVVHVPNGE